MSLGDFYCERGRELYGGGTIVAAGGFDLGGRFGDFALGLTTSILPGENSAWSDYVLSRGPFDTLLDFFPRIPQPCIFGTPGYGGGCIAAPFVEPKSSEIVQRTVQKLKECKKYGSVGRGIERLQKQGKIFLDDPTTTGAGEMRGDLGGWFRPTIHIAPLEAEQVPSTLLHEYFHYQKHAGRPETIFAIGFNKIWASLRKDKQGPLDWAADGFARSVISACGLQ